MLAEAYIQKIGGCNIVDHRNQNKLDNSLSNLHWTTTRGNAQNRTTQSIYGHNITVDKRRKNISYEVKIQIDGKQTSKSFKTHSEALEYRDSELAGITYEA